MMRASLTLLAWSLLPLLAALPARPARADGPQVVSVEGQPAGALTGKRIAVDPGHGLYWHDTYGWLYQRDPINGLHEDLHTNEIVMDFVRAHLEGAGARVLSTRSPSRQAVSVIVDETDPGYRETGAFQKTTNVGLGWKGSYRYASVARGGVTATATWSTTLPHKGDYPVWAFYYAGADRSARARFTIRHAGGETRVVVNQQLDRQRWVYLGTYPFSTAQPAEVTLDNHDPAAAPGSDGVIIADAVRFGVGMGTVEHNGKPSGKPRWHEESYYYLLDHGAPESVYKTRATERDSGLVGRPLYADWQGADAFVSLHTNAAEMPNVGSGLSTYIHDTNPTPGSAQLQARIHDEILRTTRASYAPTIRDRGKLSANFAVVREIKTMPAVLLEVLFHDNAEPDARLLRDPGYRRDMARAIYKGVLRYFDARAPITPIAPKLLSATQLGDGLLRLRWQGQDDPLEPTATATSYQVQLMRGDTGFGTWVDVQGSELVISGLRAGEPLTFQVRGVNAGGAGLPSSPLSVTLLPGAEPGRPMPMTPMTPDPVVEEPATGCALAPRLPRAASVLPLGLLGLVPVLLVRRRRRAGR
ncbi:MAG: N-acetylmuramoyl-L-alanine amidase [Polyangia bacterium]